MINDKVVLITGGTGSLGKKCTEVILKKYKPKKLIIFSRDELKQYEMSQMFSREEYPFIRYFIGDVRDRDRLDRAFQGVDYIIHTAALKHVPAAEYNPFEAVKTNIIGAQNVINAASNQKVKKVVALSTDKAADPINLYGATKLCSDKLFIAGNSYAGENYTVFSVVRFGNLIGSRGSVVPFFLKQMETGILPITCPEMTRFWITPEQASGFVLACLGRMVGGELFVPKLPSMSIMDVARAIAPECRTKIVGIRPGDKLHEIMISKDDARRTIEFDDHYVIQPDFRYFKYRFKDETGKPVPEHFEYNSKTNNWRLTIEELRDIIRDIKIS